MRILIINARDVRRTPYHQWLEGQGHELVLLTTRSSFKSMSLEVRQQYSRIVALERFRAADEFRRGVARARRGTTIDHVIALSELDLGRAARLRDRLDIPGQSWASVKYFRDKLPMKRALLEAGIPVPAFAEVKGLADAAEFVEVLGKPALLKLRRGAGSLGIWRLDTPADVSNLPEQTVPPDAPRRWMVEEYIQGELFHVDGAVLDGAVTLVTCSAYLEAPLAFRDGRPGGSYLLEPGTAIHQALAEFASRCLGALPTPANAAFHMDIFRTPSGQLLAGEVACRAAGNRIRDMIAAGCGIDLERIVLKAQLSGDVEEPTAAQTHCAGWAAIRRRPGTLIRRLPSPPFAWMQTPRLHVRQGERMSEARSSIDSLWSFVATGRSSCEVRERLVEGLEWGQQALEGCVSRPSALPRETPPALMEPPAACFASPSVG